MFCSTFTDFFRLKYYPIRWRKLILFKKSQCDWFLNVHKRTCCAWHFAPKIHFLVNKLFIQNNPSNSTFILSKNNVIKHSHIHTHSHRYLPGFFAHGTELQALSLKNEFSLQGMIIFCHRDGEKEWDPFATAGSRAWENHLRRNRDFLPWHVLAGGGWGAKHRESGLLSQGSFMFALQGHLPPLSLYLIATLVTWTQLQIVSCYSYFILLLLYSAVLQKLLPN